jgi:phosphonate transport system permease protein
MVLGLAVLWAAGNADIGLEKLPGAGPRLAEFLGRMIPPDLSVWPEVLTGLTETLRIAILGTLFAVVLSAWLYLRLRPLYPQPSGARYVRCWQ